MLLLPVVRKAGPGYDSGACAAQLLYRLRKQESAIARHRRRPVRQMKTRPPGKAPAEPERVACSHWSFSLFSKSQSGLFLCLTHPRRFGSRARSSPHSGQTYPCFSAVDVFIGSCGFPIECHAVIYRFVKERNARNPKASIRNVEADGIVLI